MVTLNSGIMYAREDPVFLIALSQETEQYFVAWRTKTSLSIVCRLAPTLLRHDFHHQDVTRRARNGSQYSKPCDNLYCSWCFWSSQIEAVPNQCDQMSGLRSILAKPRKRNNRTTRGKNYIMQINVRDQLLENNFRLSSFVFFNSNKSIRPKIGSNDYGKHNQLFRLFSLSIVVPSHLNQVSRVHLQFSGKFLQSHEFLRSLWKLLHW